MVKEIAKEVFAIEAKQINNLSNLLTNDFDKSIEAILNSKGKLILSGMGKSGIIAKKIAATLASTGTPSFFLHPGEAYHGDLGMIEPNDVVLLISNSGETDEILKLIPFVKNQGNKTISMSGNTNSTLAKNTNFHINISVEKEACPLQLAPTSSTTATLVMGDAIAVSLMKMRGFTDERFAKFHPGGSLGRRLLTKVLDVMKSTDLPTCKPNTNIIEVVHTITNGKCGLVIVLNDGEVVGVITDGDIRRAMKNSQANFFNYEAENLMSLNPKFVYEDEKLIVAETKLQQEKINALIVKNRKNCLSGIIQIYDISL